MDEFMRKKFGLAVFFLGLGMLGLWAALITAPRIEADIRVQADAITAQSLHHMTVTVSGRDITLHGMANDRDELIKIKQSLSKISGQRDLRLDDVQMLAPALPFLFSITKDDGVRVAGFVPSELARADLAKIFGDQVKGLTLASGAPDDWMGLVTLGLKALDPLPRGMIRLEGSAMILTGEADTPDQAALVVTQVAGRTDPTVNAVQVMDDGTATKYGLNYQRIGGTSLRGKLPKGLTIESMQTALGVPKIKGKVQIARIGPMGDATYLTAWGQVLDQLESLTSSVDGDDRKVLAKLIPDADADRVRAALETGGFVVRLTETPKPIAEGDTRSNPQTGVAEIYKDGTWIAAEPVEPTTSEPAAAEPATGDPGFVQPRGNPPVAAKPVIQVPVQSDNKMRDIHSINQPILVAAEVVTPLTSAPIKSVFATPDMAKTSQDRVETVTPIVAKIPKPVARPAFLLDKMACQMATNRLLTQNSVIFLPNLDALDSGGAEVMAQLAQVMLPCAKSGLRAEIGGHTDVSGDAGQNLILSQQRADRVRAMLIANTVPETALIAKGYGSSQPIAGNDTPEGRAQNRRTTVTWLQ
jgi:outer membrane protein OmpA-like peptidoglycan-associated protein